MATLYQYRVWCEDENAYHLVWGEDDPTTCPINAAHTIDATKTTVVQTVTEDLPMSRILDGKLAVHSSSKPEPADSETFVVWTGAGDDLNAPEESSNGSGDLLSFNVPFGTPVVTKDVHFDPRHGRVWIHEAYVKFENGGIQDYITADIIAPPTQLQQVANLDLIVDGDGWVSYSTGSPAGTHGFAANPVLIPRTYSNDGQWDYTPETGLVPNFTNTGLYRISTNEQIVSRYVNRIPCYGSTNNYFTMTSDETAELPVASGYFLRIQAHNESNTTWHVSVFMEIYRERTSH